MFAIFRSPVGTSLQYDSSDIRALPHWPTYLPVVAMAGTIGVPEGLGSQSYTVPLGDGVVSEDSAMADNTAPQTSTTTVPGSPFARTHYWPSTREVHCTVTMSEVHAAACFHTNLIDNSTIDTEILDSLDHWEAG